MEAIKNKYSVLVFLSNELIYSENLEMKDNQSIKEVILKVNEKIQELNTNRIKNEAVSIPTKMSFVINEIKVVDE